MNRYKTNQIVAFNHTFTGVIGLNELQVSKRVSCIVPHVDDDGNEIAGQFKVKKEIQFKAGEVIGLNEVPKELESKLDPPDSKKPSKNKRASKNKDAEE